MYAQQKRKRKQKHTLRLDFACAFIFRSSSPLSSSSRSCRASSSYSSEYSASLFDGCSRVTGALRGPEPYPSKLTRGCDDRLPCRAWPTPLPFTCELSVGAVLREKPDSCVSYDADERDADDREENDTVDVGGDWGGSGMAAGSTFATLATILCTLP